MGTTQFFSSVSLGTVISVNTKSKEIWTDAYIFPHQADDLVDFLDCLESFLEEFKENITPSYYVTNDGIGPYECHGYKGYDKGKDYIEVEGNQEGDFVLSFIFDHSKPSTEEILRLMKTVAEHANAHQKIITIGDDETTTGLLSTDARIGSQWEIAFDSKSFKDDLGNVYSAKMHLFWE